MLKNKYIKAALIVGGTMFSGSIGMYFCKFWGVLSPVQSDWGNFGSYVAGIGSIISAVLLFFNLIGQTEQLNQAHEQIEQGREQLNQAREQIEQGRNESKFNSAIHLETKAREYEQGNPKELIEALIIYMSAFKVYWETGYHVIAESILPNMEKIIDGMWDLEYPFHLDSKYVTADNKKRLESAIKSCLQFIDTIKNCSVVIDDFQKKLEKLQKEIMRVN